jgi:hypothetical protein
VTISTDNDVRNAELVERFRGLGMSETAAVAAAMGRDGGLVSRFEESVRRGREKIAGEPDDVRLERGFAGMGLSESSAREAARGRPRTRAKRADTSIDPVGLSELAEAVRERCKAITGHDKPVGAWATKFCLDEFGWDGTTVIDEAKARQFVRSTKVSDGKVIPITITEQRRI